MLRVRNIQKAFGDTPVLKDVSFQVDKGDVIAILGPSGSGKTTLLRCLNFLEGADGGEMDFDGETLRFGQVRRRDVAPVRQRTAFVFQSYNLFANKTALGNVTEGLITARHMPKAQAEAIGMEMLRKVGLADRRDHYPIQLSGGQQQRGGRAPAPGPPPPQKQNQENPDPPHPPPAPPRRPAAARGHRPRAGHAAQDHLLR